MASLLIIIKPIKVKAMKRKSKGVFFLLLLFSSIASAQTKTLSWEEFKQAIINYHPLAQKAALLPKYAQTELGMARAAFDPLLEASQSEKALQSINYYATQNIALKLPTWYGVDLNVGADNMMGQRLNPSDTKGQLYYLGANVSLLRNVITDKRRTALRQAYLTKEMSQLEKQVLLNDLLMEAAQVYWEWTKTYANRQVINEGVANLQQRVEFIHQNILHGERAVIDSIELDATLQSFLTRKNQVELEWLNASLQVSSFLWQSDGLAYELPTDVSPALDLTKLSLNEVLALQQQNTAMDPQQHPTIFWYDKKIGQIQLEQKLKRQELLPKLDMKYNYWLKPGYSTQANLNYTLGFQFQMPLTLAFSRNQYKASKLKLQEAEWMRSDKQRQINIKFKSYLNESTLLAKQLQAQSAALTATRLLLEAERQKFAVGESSVFMINQREQKYLETLEKLIELKAKSLKNNQAILWSLGTLAGKD